MRSMPDMMQAIAISKTRKPYLDEAYPWVRLAASLSWHCTGPIFLLRKQVASNILYIMAFFAYTIFFVLLLCFTYQEIRM